ncbi:MAG: sulfurtransferase TusA family protein [Hydrogenoanaerobacterium sp.]
MIDTRGFSCPMPVVMVQKAIKTDSPSTLEVLVDNECSTENVTRFAEICGYTVAVTKEGGDSRMVLKK